MPRIYVGNDPIVGAWQLHQAIRAALWYDPYQKTRSNYRCCNGCCYDYALLACQTALLLYPPIKRISTYTPANSNVVNMSLGEQVSPYVGKINYRKNLTPDLAIIRVQPADGGSVPDFKAGQFVALGMKLDGDYDITYRPYSLSSPPEEKSYFEFYIKFAREHMMS